MTLDGIAIDASPTRLRAAFGRCENAERAQLRDMRIEQNRLAAITRSDRAMRRHVIATAKLERELDGMVFRLTARVHEKKKAVPRERRKRPDVEPVRRLPRLGIVVVDRAGRRAIFVEVIAVGANQPRYRPGCCRLHFNYVWADNAVERLASGELARCSNMGATLEQIAAAMDLKEDVARASRANANLEIRIIVCLPNDISPEGRLEIIQVVCETFFGRNGLPYAAAVHPPDPHSDDRNAHGHIQGSFRPMCHVGGMDWEVGAELRTDLSRPDGMRLLRAIVADTMTEVCRKEGRPRTYTSLSNQERGLAMKPLKKVGREQTEAYRRGEDVGVVEENKRLIADNLTRYAKQRMEWLKEALAGLRHPKISNTGAALQRSDIPVINTPHVVEIGDAAKERAGLPAAVIPLPIMLHQTRETPMLAPPKRGLISPTIVFEEGKAVLSGRAIGTFASVAGGRSSWSLASPELPANFVSEGSSTPRPAALKVALPVPLEWRAPAPGIDDALLLFELRAAQKKDRDALAARRRKLLDRHLFQQGDTGKPTAEYTAFLLAIRDDPTLLRWELDKSGKRQKPVLNGGDEAFRDRFTVYMQHPAVARQVGAVLDQAYAPGVVWPDELAHGMWSYEPGRYGHRSVAAARAGWGADDTGLQERITPSDRPVPLLAKVDDLVMPDPRQVQRWPDVDLVRLLHPSTQEHLTISWREQQEERVECLAAAVDRHVRIERRLLPSGAGAWRSTVIAHAPPPSLAGAFARWQNDPEFYLDIAVDSAVAKAAADRKLRCADPRLRALQAAEAAGDTPAVRRVLAMRAGVLTREQQARRSATPVPSADKARAGQRKERQRSRSPTPRRS